MGKHSFSSCWGLNADSLVLAYALNPTSGQDLLEFFMGGIGFFCGGALGGVRLFAGETALGNGRFAFGLGGANLDAKIIFYVP